MEDLKSRWAKLKTANIVAVIITAFCGAYLISLLFIEVPENNRDIVNFLSGSFFGTALGGVIYFLFNYKKSNDNEYDHTSICSSCGQKEI